MLLLLSNQKRLAKNHLDKLETLKNAITCPQIRRRMQRRALDTLTHGKREQVDALSGEVYAEKADFKDAEKVVEGAKKTSA